MSGGFKINKLNWIELYVCVCVGGGEHQGGCCSLNTAPPPIRYTPTEAVPSPTWYTALKRNCLSMVLQKIRKLTQPSTTRRRKKKLIRPGTTRNDRDFMGKYLCSQWRIYGGGVRGFNPPPPLGLPSKNLMCIEKRHHNMSRPTQYVPIALCLRLSLRQ